MEFFFADKNKIITFVNNMLNYENNKRKQ